MSQSRVPGSTNDGDGLASVLGNGALQAGVYRNADNDSLWVSTEKASNVSQGVTGGGELLPVTNGGQRMSARMPSGNHSNGEVGIPRGTDFRIVRNCTRFRAGRFVFDAKLASVFNMTESGIESFTYLESYVNKRGLPGVANGISPPDLILGSQKVWRSWVDRFGEVHGWELEIAWWGARLYLTKSLAKALMIALAAGSAAAWAASVFPPASLPAGVLAAMLAFDVAVIAANENCNGVYINVSPFYATVTDGRDG